MNILVILGHPEANSFNHAMAVRVIKTLTRSAHTVTFHDLYAEGFDPVMPYAEIPEKAVLPEDIKLHCQDLVSADGIIVIHPNWWGQPPAMVKGWIDRVLRPGVAYQFLEGDGGQGVPVGLLRARTAVVLNTSNTQKKRELDVFGDPLETLWKKCIFDLCGVTTFFRTMFSTVVESTPLQRSAWLDEVEEIVERHFPAGS